MQISELVGQVAGFDIAPPKDKIKFFAWWQRVYGGKGLFGPADIRACFGRVHVDEAAALATYIARMEGKELLKEKASYELARLQLLARMASENRLVWQLSMAQLVKFGRRNIAARPSDVVIVQSRAYDAITDLVDNVVLTLS